MIFAPESAAKWIAAMRSEENMLPSLSETFIGRIVAFHASPAVPSPLSAVAAITPVTSVPWPLLSE